MKGLQIYVYSRNCLYLGYTYMNLQRFNISLRKRITIFLYLQSWRVFFIINNVHHYLSLFIIYIYWRISIFKLFPFFLPSFCYIPKKDERERWLTISKNYWKGCRYMYIQEIVCIWVMHIWIFKGFNINLRKKRTTVFFCLQSLRVFLLFKMGNVKKDGHTGGVREMSICRIATATVNI